ncbi:hypothetical protein EVAR_74393_1 [Eumeta japonica]|uniref:Uncharacterized protein n=1 Tax=Eumeta variegata TaxID=151549 RepID=A0A4C1SD46_EUMVA|nr:hypothetical protein EVAR_74393_1 [Eumeta japonica]
MCLGSTDSLPFSLLLSTFVYLSFSLPLALEYWTLLVANARAGLLQEERNPNWGLDQVEIKDEKWDQVQNQVMDIIRYKKCRKPFYDHTGEGAVENHTE